MGVNLKDLLEDYGVIKQVNDLKELKGKVIAIDAYNALYQFLAAIRQPDGTPLMDSKGRITSHLSGLFYRTINLMEDGLKPVYVFDGKPPELKAKELAERTQFREEALKKYEKAVSEGRLDEARKYAQATGKLTTDMVKASKDLLKAMGVPYVEAPSEGEAQAAYMTRKGDAWASASQDYDSLLFNTVRLIRNLTISGKRKLPGKEVYVEIKPELIELESLLRELGVTREQLIDIAIFIGTDYNPDGVKGVGPKTALKLVKTYGSFEKAIKALPGVKVDFNYEEVRRIFLNPPVTDAYVLNWSEPDVTKVTELLVEEYDFSKERVENALERLKKAYRENIRTSVKGLDMWFKKK
ncbi:MAG: flap endonuclease-1 [Zestosphaera tikiterensis]|uniref:Flap endonuclease 1 n=1 Tax=Zestosphaera tikiterensis TaxID=1973259 RepID=A0A2R7Y6D5_9CREN|nr:MAG: flap endonuclease-1 [Zestosphaera tikiterensis]